MEEQIINCHYHPNDKEKQGGSQAIIIPKFGTQIEKYSIRNHDPPNN